MGSSYDFWVRKNIQLTNRYTLSIMQIYVMSR